jgi:hypothetical protein
MTFPSLLSTENSDRPEIDMKVTSGNEALKLFFHVIVQLGQLNQLGRW